MTERVLLTGGNGFVGSHLIRRLIREHFIPVVLVRENSDLSRLHQSMPDIELISYKDFFSNKVDDEYETLIHLATYYKRSHVFADIEQMVYTNVTMSTKVLEQAIKFGVRSVVNMSTFFRYDLTMHRLSEKSVVKPFDLYAATKVAFEKILDYYAFERHISALTLVLFSLYGSNDNPNKLIPYLLRCFLDGKTAHLSTGSQRMDLTYISDVVDAIIASIQYNRNSAPKEPRQEIFNIGSGKNFNTKEVAMMIKDVLGRRVDIVWEKRDAYDRYDCSAVTTKANRLLQWTPKFDLHAGLQDMIHRNV